VREFLDEVFGYLDLDWEKYVEIDPRYFRPSEVELLLGDPAKAKQKLGWEAEVDLKDLAKMMVDSDMQIAHDEKAVSDSRAARE
jgi:GDPmannose 4,6-dehydratase